MNRKLMVAIPVIAGVLALGSGAGVAFAKSADQTASYRPASNYDTAPAPGTSDTSPTVGYCGFGGMMGFGAGGGLVTSQVAALLGMTVADLQAQLNSGQTLADLAAAKGVSQDQLVQTIMAPFDDQMALMLKYSYLTQDQIDTMTQQMRDRLQTMINSQLNASDEAGPGFMGNMMRGFAATPQEPGTTPAPRMGYRGMMGGYNNAAPQQPGTNALPRMGGGMMGRW